MGTPDGTQTTSFDIYTLKNGISAKPLFVVGALQSFP